MDAPLQEVPGYSIPGTFYSSVPSTNYEVPPTRGILVDSSYDRPGAYGLYSTPSTRYEVPPTAEAPMTYAAPAVAAGAYGATHMTPVSTFSNLSSTNEATNRTRRWRWRGMARTPQHLLKTVSTNTSR